MLSTVDPHRAERPLILALDIGTSSTRALLFDQFGRDLVGMEARQNHTVRTTPAGASEIDPDVLLEQVWRCIDELLERAGSLDDDIAAVAACSFVSNVFGVDEDRRPLTPLITYADTRAAGDAAHLRELLDEEAVHQRTGCPFHSSYLPARFRWLARMCSPVFERVDRWISIGEYMEWQLFGRTAVSYSVASWTGLLDRRRLVWDGPLLAALRVREERLSSLTDVGVPRRGLHEPFACRWPALNGVPWFPTVGDGATANVGSGCASFERVALTMGTTSGLRLVTEETVDRVPDGLWCYRVDGRRSLPGGAMSAGGNLFAWLNEVLDLPPLAELEPLLAAMEPDDHGLTFLPFLAGERSPGWAGDARATIHDLSLATTPVHILRAGMEAVAYRAALILDRLGPLLPDDFTMVASGGALLNSRVWLQIVADVLGRTVVPSRVREASARGAALLALEALGALDDVTDAPPLIGDPVTADPEHHERYREGMERQRELYETLVKGHDADLGSSS